MTDLILLLIFCGLCLVALGILGNARYQTSKIINDRYTPDRALTAKHGKSNNNTYSDGKRI